MRNGIVGVVVDLKEAEVLVDKSLGGLAVSVRDEIGYDVLDHEKVVGDGEAQTA